LVNREGGKPAFGRLLAFHAFPYPSISTARSTCSRSPARGRLLGRRLPVAAGRASLVSGGSRSEEVLRWWIRRMPSLQWMSSRLTAKTSLARNP
jgi:hypothetical protein